MLPKLSAEFLGTFWLVLGGCGSAILAGAFPALGIGFAGVSLAFGLTVLTGAYALGPISGGHFNPAVTLAVFIRGRCDAKDVLPYWIAQVAAAVAAAFVAMFLVGKSGTPMDLANIPQAFVAEFLFTFALAYVVLNCATAKGTLDNSFYGLAIGFTVMVGAFSVGAISGGAFNPAVAVGIAFMKLVSFSQVWIPIVADLVGAFVAAISFKIINPDDK